MNRHIGFWIGLGLASLVARPVVAEPAPPAPPAPAADEEQPADETAGPDVAAVASRIEELETRLKTSEQSRKARFPIKITGYVRYKLGDGIDP